MYELLTALPEDDWAVPRLLLERHGADCDRLAFLIIRPEAVHQGYTLDILRRAAELGLTAAATKVLRPHSRQLEELYRYTQVRLMDSGNRPLWSYTPRYYALGPALVLLLRGQFSDRAAAEVLNEAKGPSNPALTRPGQLRYDYGSQNMVMCVIHSSDVTETAMREASIFFDRGTLEDVLRDLSPVDAAAAQGNVAALLKAQGLPVRPVPLPSFHQLLARIQSDILRLLPFPDGNGRRVAEQISCTLHAMAEEELADLSYERRTSAFRRLWDSAPARSLLLEVDQAHDLGAFLVWSARLEQTGSALMDRVVAALRKQGVDIDSWDEITLDTGFGFHSLIMSRFVPGADDALVARADLAANS